jgi:hypothetical protein
MNEPTPCRVAGWSAAPITKAIRFLLVVVLLLAFPLSARSQILVTFDDLSATPPGPIPNGYQGLDWSNDFQVLDARGVANSGVGTNGYYYGMVSPSNVAFNAGGYPTEVDSATDLDFFSAYLTGAWNSNLNIQVEGFNGAQEIYNTIVVASATNPTLFTFDYFDIDRLYFNSYGGEPAFGVAANTFVMDNFLFEFIPEPSTLLLVVLGAVPLCALLRCKRT